MRYKSHLVAQGFSQTFGIDYVEIYSRIPPIMDAKIFRFLMSLAADDNQGDTSHDCVYNMFIWIFRYWYLYENLRWI